MVIREVRSRQTLASSPQLGCGQVDRVVTHVDLDDVVHQEHLDYACRVDSLIRVVLKDQRVDGEVP